MEEEQPFNPNHCANCGNPQIVDGYPTPLCSECRNSLVKFPVPKWIWLFAAGIGLAVIYGLVTMPRYFNTVVQLRKAEKAVEEHNYVTARTAASEVLKRYPDNMEANAYNFIANTYCLDFDQARKAYEHIAGKQVDDRGLLDNVNGAVDFIESLEPTDSTLLDRIAEAVEKTPEEQVAYFRQEVKEGKMEGINKAALGVMMANNLMDKEAYAACDSILIKTLALYPSHYSALSLQTALYRKTGEYNKAMEICDRLLYLNHEDAVMIAQKAKIELRQQHNKAAEALVEQALKLSPKEASALEARALLYYFNGRKEESNKLLAQIKELDTTVSVRLSKVLDGSVTYR